MIEKFLEFLKDPNDQLSSKRLIGFWATIHVTGYIWFFTYWGTLSAEAGLTAFMTMVVAVLGATTFDHWSK